MYYFRPPAVTIFQPGSLRDTHIRWACSRRWGAWRCNGLGCYTGKNKVLLLGLERRWLDWQTQSPWTPRQVSKLARLSERYNHLSYLEDPAETPAFLSLALALALAFAQFGWLCQLVTWSESMLLLLVCVDSIYCHKLSGYIKIYGTKNSKGHPW